MAVRTVLIADSNTRLSELLGLLLEDEPEFHTVGVHSSAPEVLATAAQARPDIVLLSERLGGRSVEELCTQLRTVLPDAALVMWSHQGDALPAGSLAVDVVLERGMTFRQLADVLHDVRHEPAGDGAEVRRVAMASPRSDLPVPAAPAQAAPADQEDAAGGMLLTCDTCRVRLRLPTEDIAPAVVLAREFFTEHAQCDTGIDLAQRDADGART